MNREPLDVVAFESTSHSQTDAFAGALARVLKPGDVVALEGQMGAGKTYLVRHLAAVLTGEPETANSPTFGIVQVYDGAVQVVHIDAYRLKGSEEFERLGGAELFDPTGVTLIEWSERIPESLPRERWVISISHASEEARSFLVRSMHPDGEQRLQGLMQASRGG